MSRPLFSGDCYVEKVSGVYLLNSSSNSRFGVGSPKAGMAAGFRPARVWYISRATSLQAKIRICQLEITKCDIRCSLG